jgi:hypothetical protein
MRAMRPRPAEPDDREALHDELVLERRLDRER